VPNKSFKRTAPPPLNSSVRPHAYISLACRSRIRMVEQFVNHRSLKHVVRFAYRACGPRRYRQLRRVPFFRSSRLPSYGRGRHACVLASCSAGPVRFISCHCRGLARALSWSLLKRNLRARQSARVVGSFIRPLHLGHILGRTTREGVRLMWPNQSFKADGFAAA
jgi:hypothetical protein